MHKIKLTLFVDPATAVLAGKTLVGEKVVELDESDIAQLTETQRNTLAEHLRYSQFAPTRLEEAYRAPLWKHAAPLGEVTPESLRFLLDQRYTYVEKVRGEIWDEQKKRADLQAERERAEAERQTKRKAEIDVLMALPIEELISYTLPQGSALSYRELSEIRADERLEFASKKVEARRAAEAALVRKWFPDEFPVWEAGYANDELVHLARASELGSICEGAVSRTLFPMRFEDSSEATAGRIPLNVDEFNAYREAEAEIRAAIADVDIYPFRPYRKAREGEAAGANLEGDVADTSRLCISVTTKVAGLSTEVSFEIKPTPFVQVPDEDSPF